MGGVRVGIQIVALSPRRSVTPCCLAEAEVGLEGTMMIIDLITRIHYSKLILQVQRLTPLSAELSCPVMTTSLVVSVE